MRDGWQQVKFKDVATATKGKLPKAKNELGIGMPYLTANFLRKRIPDLWVQDLDGAVLAEDGDCLILWDGAGAGDLFSAVDGVVSSTMAVVKSQNRNILRQFLTLSISSKSSYIKDTCRGTTVPHVSPDAIAEMDLSLPPLPEQERIVDLVSSVDFYIEALRQQLDSAKISKNAVLDELLTAGGDGWTETTLGDAVSVVNGGTPSTKQEQFWGGEITWITTTELTACDGRTVDSSKRTITDDGLKSGATKMVRAGATLVGTTATIGTCAMVACDLTFNQQISGLIPKTNKVDDVYLFYWIQFSKPILENLSAGTSFRRISTTALKTVSIKYPPLPEQERIVDLISSVDSYIDALEGQINSSMSLRSGLLSDLFSGNHEIPASYDQLIGAA